MAKKNALAYSEMRETPVRNRLAQYAGNALSAVDQFARKPFGYDNPPVAMLSDAVGLPAVASTLNRLAYGDRLTQGQGQTLQLRPEVLDAALAVAPVAAKFPKATLGAAGMLAGAADTGGMSRAATVFHGTPHKFDKFDSSKIGTGEGAQAYGHGLYLAESPGVAASYRDALSQGQKWTPQLSTIRLKDGRSVNKGDSDFGIYSSILNKSVSVDDIPYIAEAALQRYEMLKARGIPEDASPIKKKWAQGSIDDAYKEYQAALMIDTSKAEGQLYGVDLPDEAIANMIDWDNGGEDVWKAALKKHKTPANAAAALRAQGIPGIKYLDAVSRNGEAGTSNFVVFPGNENMLTILERNGQAVKQ